MKVLLVDDEVELVSTLAERLTLRGYEAAWADTPSKALELVESEPFDIAVLDVKMPKVSGIELRRRMAALRPELKFIFITGHGSSEDFATGSAEGAFYLIKPVRIETLIGKIHEALHGEADH